MARSFRDRLSPLAVVLAGAVLLSCAGGYRGPYLLHPLPPEGEGLALDRGGIRYRGPGFEAVARPVDWRHVGELYGEAGLAAPFEEESLSRYLFFSLLLENRSSATLFFNPRRSLLRCEGPPFQTDRSDFLYPVDLSDVYRQGGEAEGRAASFRKTVFDQTEEIQPGGTLERYLVFPSPRGKVRTVALLLDDLYLGAGSFDLAFTFEAFPADEGR